MATPVPVTILPYRELNNHDVAYVPAPNAVPLVDHARWSDSDGEPLIRPDPLPTQLDEDSMMRFTATGRPIPAFKFSTLQSLGGDMYSVPQHLPKRYTDDSIIPAIVVDVIPAKRAEMAVEEGRRRRSSFLGRLKGEKKKDDGRPITKVVYMPRRDYLKHFARGVKGEYVGTEPYKQWTEEELDGAFRQYKPVVEAKKGYVPPY